MTNKDIHKQKYVWLFEREPIWKYWQKPHTQIKIQPEIQKCSTLVNKEQIKYLSQLQPTGRTLLARIKVRKENNPIRPLVNSTQAPNTLVHAVV